MEVLIQSPHFTLTQDLNDFVKDKVSNLSHLYEKIENADVLLKIEKSEPAENKVCEIRIAVPGNHFFAKRHSDTFEDATTKAIDALHEQIEKMKTKSESHH